MNTNTQHKASNTIEPNIKYGRDMFRMHYYDDNIYIAELSGRNFDGNSFKFEFVANRINWIELKNIKSENIHSDVDEYSYFADYFARRGWLPDETKNDRED